MSNIIVAVRPYLEIGSFAATTILVIGIMIGWRQLTAFNKDSRARNERLAREKAIDASTRYLSRYVDLCNTEFGKREETGFSPHRGEVGDFLASSLDIKVAGRAAAHMEKTSWSLAHLNELEAISSYFVSGVADEETGFGIIGRSFCHTVRDYYVVISLLRGDDQVQPYWHNIVQLYRLWAPRLTRREFNATANNLAEQIARLPVERRLKPVGC